MPKFQKVAPIVDAVQWDGTQTDVSEILGFIVDSGKNTMFDVKYKIKKRKIVHAIIKIERIFSGTLHPSDWLVMDHEGFKIIKNAAFVKEYREVIASGVKSA